MPYIYPWSLEIERFKLFVEVFWRWTLFFGILHLKQRLWYDGESLEKVFENLRYQIIRSVQAFHYALQGDKNAKKEIESIYKKIAASYRNTLEIISDIAKNPRISSEILTIAIDDYHLSESFTKSLRNTLAQIGFVQIYLQRNGPKDQEA